MISASISTNPIQRRMFDSMEGFSTGCCCGSVTHAGIIPPCQVKGSRKKSKHIKPKGCVLKDECSNGQGGGGGCILGIAKKNPEITR